MLDPMNVRLAQTLSDERLKAAEQRRQRRNWNTEPTIVERMRAALSRWTSASREQPQAHTSVSRHDVGLSR
ncbi:MAG TPA: hypothetical protein VFX76_21755 [Roseiflexaceae bacterium]|nr:hypothetical protein [Roseiflexaceae bacterium]